MPVVKNGDLSYIKCEDCDARLTSYMEYEQAKNYVAEDCVARCPRCAYIERECR